MYEISTDTIDRPATGFVPELRSRARKEVSEFLTPKKQTNLSTSQKHIETKEKA